jgi:Trm5-related predicted tRNA methylase
MINRMSSNLMCLMSVDQEVFGRKVGQEAPNLANSLLISPTHHDLQSHNDPQMSLDYHLVDPLGDDEQDEQQSDVLDGYVMIRRFLAEKLDKKLQEAQNHASSLLITPIHHDLQNHNDPQMSLDYHLVESLKDDEQDEQQSDVLDGYVMIRRFLAEKLDKKLEEAQNHASSLLITPIHHYLQNHNDPRFLAEKLDKKMQEAPILPAAC